MKNIFEDIANGNFLKVVYFDIHVLERYFNNPKYYVFYSGYRGKISIKDEFYEESDGSEYVKNFGLAYDKKNSEKRAIVAFTTDLSNLSTKAQAHWYSFMYDKSENYYPNNGFVKNLINGEWVDDISIFNAMLMEIQIINLMCSSIGITNFFREEFSPNSMNKEDKPINFHVILLPTRDNYYNFINTLEKLVINNIQPQAFIDNSHLIRGVERKTNEGYNKGTLLMLSEWFAQNNSANNVDTDIIAPLKKLRKLRQKPAHKLYKNVYDEKIWTDQKKIMHSTYSAIRWIRLLLTNHPLCEKVEVPDILFNGTNIVQY